MKTVVEYINGNVYEFNRKFALVDRHYDKSKLVNGGKYVCDTKKTIINRKREKIHILTNFLPVAPDTGFDIMEQSERGTNWGIKALLEDRNDLSPEMKNVLIQARAKMEYSLAQITDQDVRDEYAMVFQAALGELAEEYRSSIES